MSYTTCCCLTCYITPAHYRCCKALAHKMLYNTSQCYMAGGFCDITPKSVISHDPMFQMVTPGQDGHGPTGPAGSTWAWEFRLLVSLFTWLSTSMQSLEHSIKGSTKLGQVKIGQHDYVKCSIPDSLYQLLFGCLTSFQCLLGHQGVDKDHHGQHPKSLLKMVCKLTLLVCATSTFNSRQKISLRISFRDPAFVDYLDRCNR